MTTLKWRAPEYEHHHKSRIWFIIMWVVFLLLIFRAFLNKGFVEMVVWFLCAFILTIYASREPKTITFEIDAKGIRAGKHFYSFNEIDSFWIFYDPPETKNVSFILKHHLTSHLHIPLGETNPIEVRDILINILPEVEQKESLAETVLKALRF